MNKQEWYQLSGDESVIAWGSDYEKGLGAAEVARRQQQYSNELTAVKGVHPAFMLLKQFTDTMVLVLLAATVISGLIGAMTDAITIMAIVILNAVLGFIQEYRAEKSLQAIKEMVAPVAMVVRAGHHKSVPAKELVPGDIVLLEAGDRVPADLRLLSSSGMEADESSLTGESLPVNKDHRVIYTSEIMLAERSNMAFMGTTITRGRGCGVIVATGMDTVMGNIAAMIQEEKQQMTPLQVRLDQLGKYLIIICLSVCAMVAGLGIYRGEAVMTMFMAGISLAVAAIPEGLPAIVTVVLALGVQRMAGKNAIVRRLSAVETLGCTTVICSDKTGTLTQNQMKVKRMATMGGLVETRSDEIKGNSLIYRNSRMVKALNDPESNMLLTIAGNCNNAVGEKTAGRTVYSGDPTEIALQTFALNGAAVFKGKRVKEIPFDSERKLMSVMVENNGEYLLLVKGAPEVVMASCSALLKGEKVERFQERDREYFAELQARWGKEALRVLGFAYRYLTPAQATELSDDNLESDLILVGICGMIDPPRPGVAGSVQECLRAGITPVMITGDHPLTAGAIAREIGLSSSEEVISGALIDEMSDKELYDKAMRSRIFARVSPQHKNRIVKVLQGRNQVVAMTGDGVNDAPALKSADIGVAMGKSGTEVSREAASMILADDNFSTIVQAVYEGRAIYDNIRKFIRYLLGCNIGEVLVMFMASLLGMPMPLLPIQLLWVNLITDGLPAMALGVEPPEPGIMLRTPRPKNEGIFERGLGWIIGGRGIYIAVVTLAAFTVGLLWSRLSGSDSLDVARTMALTTLVFAQLFYVFECRSEHLSPFELGFWSNPYLVGAVACSTVMQMAVLYLPGLQQIFHTVALIAWQWILILLLSGGRLLWKYILYTWQRLFVSPLKYGKINA
ncbi:MAG: cation-translocating P-type ATPase [Syntrophomonadaceae bacterium]|nr:cation-translocating P-type ATPase [Syntrophomonadaceae bacterium]